MTLDMKAIAWAVNQRISLCENVPPCPACGEAHQIQLFEYISEVIWKCRECKHKWKGERIKG